MTRGDIFSFEAQSWTSIDEQRQVYELRTISFRQGKPSFLVLSPGHPRTCESVSRRRTHLVVKTTRGREWGPTSADRRWTCARECRRFLSLLRPPSPENMAIKHPRETRSSRRPVNTTRRRGSRSKGPCMRGHIIRLSYNPSSARSSVHEQFLLRVLREENSGLFVYLRFGFRASSKTRVSRRLLARKRDFGQWWRDWFRVRPHLFLVSLRGISCTAPKNKSFFRKVSGVYFYVSGSVA